MAPADAQPRRVTPTLRLQQPDDAAAVRDFNARLVASGVEIPFLLSESVGTGGALDKRPWLLLDGDVVRGGVLLTHHRAIVAGAAHDVVNVQAPLTEAIADKRHAALSLWLFRELQRRFTHVYAVGMGAVDRPLPRLLASLKWQVGLAPFRFVPLRPGRVASRVGAIRGRIPVAARPLTPAVGAVAGVCYRGVLRLIGSGRLVERPGEEAAAAVARAWAGTAAGIAFGLVRDEAAARALYAAADGERVLEARDDPGCVAVVRERALSGASQFAGLRVATVLELLAPDAARRARLARSVLAHLAAGGADIAITNTTNEATIAALDATRWLRGPSNYVVALSPAFTAAGVTLEASLVTRTDGDGRLNL